MTGRRFVPALLAALVALLALPAAGWAATAVDATGGSILVQARAGDRNVIAVALADGTIAVTDDAGTTTTTCAQVSPTEVRCPASASSLYVDAGDLDDMVVNQTALASTLVGGTGGDTLVGGAGSDSIRGEEGDDVEQGGPGDDVLMQNATPDGADDLDGGTGTDTVSWQFRSAAVTADFDGLADDGGAGEGDDVRASIEKVVSGAGDDVLVGSGGDDNFYAGAGSDTLAGNGGTDALSGEDGGDTIDGGAGMDTLIGGDGDDALAARDDGMDAVYCDAGSDSAVTDWQDIVSGCERNDATTYPLPPGLQPDTIPPTARLTPTTVRAGRDGAVTLGVICSELCSGRLTLVSARGVRASSRARAIVLQLGRASFLTPVGVTSVLARVALSRAHRALLRRLGRLAVKATATLTDVGGNTGTATVAFTLKPPRARARARLRRASRGR